MWLPQDCSCFPYPSQPTFHLCRVLSRTFAAHSKLLATLVCQDPKFLGSVPATDESVMHPSHRPTHKIPVLSSLQSRARAGTGYQSRE